MKLASAPPRGGAQEPSSYYWCSIGIVLIDYQSKRRDVRTAAHCWRCDGWARRRSFFLLGRWAPTRLQKHDQHVLTYGQPARITPTSTSISASPLLLHSIGALYYTTPINNIHARRREARNEPLHPPTFQKPLVHPPSKASHPPAFIIIQQPKPAARGILSSFVYKGPRLRP